MPLYGLHGGRIKKKKAKDGGSGAYYDGTFYALKGGNTQQFWQYDIARDTWTEGDTIPTNGSTGRKKRVKYGADLVSYGGGTFYALKGNKTSEAWRYIVGSAFGPRPPGAAVAGVIGGSTPPTMTISPNPARRNAAVSYSLPSGGRARLGLYDMNGRLVMATQRDHPNAGSHTASVDVADLAAGVYVLRLECGTLQARRKLVIERGKGVRRE
jgi:hypothetical protein